MHWYSEPALWVAVGSILVNAGVTRFQVAFLWARDRDRSQENSDIRAEIASLREWRAQAREQIETLKHRDRETTEDE
jgi:hypothetical protein